jgi:hypothetical protein
MPESTAEDIPTLGATVTASRFRYVAFADMTVREHVPGGGRRLRRRFENLSAPPLPERNTAICLVLRRGTTPSCVRSLFVLDSRARPPASNVAGRKSNEHTRTPSRSPVANDNTSPSRKRVGNVECFEIFEFGLTRATGIPNAHGPGMEGTQMICFFGPPSHE